MGKVGATFLKTINKPATSLSPDDFKVSAKDFVARKGLNALTGSMQGTGQRAPMPKPRRTLFQQDYYKSTHPHADFTVGDLHGVTSRKETTTGGRI